MVSYLRSGDAADLRTIALTGESLTLGRVERNDVPVPHDSVSRVHALLEYKAGAWQLRDLSSRNGTWVNGERLQSACVLREGDEIRLGAARLTFHAELDVEDAYPFDAEFGPEVTRRERDVLEALARNYDDPLSEPASTLAIAMALFVTEAAVKQHLLNLYRKFDIPANAPQRKWYLVEAARRSGILAAV